MPNKPKTFKTKSAGAKRFKPGGDDSWRQGKTTAERGYGGKWQRARKRFLSENPFCKEHLKKGRHILARIVDHIKPHRGNDELFWDETNWQGLCKACHDKKTGKGF